MKAWNGMKAGRRGILIKYLKYYYSKSTMSDVILDCQPIALYKHKKNIPMEPGIHINNAKD